MAVRIFDRWRRGYEHLTYQDQIDFYNQVELLWPKQQGFSIRKVKRVLSYLNKPFKVLEFGGWKGELAEIMINYFGNDIFSWKNIEICKSAIEKTVCISEKYIPIFPNKFDWFCDVRTEKDDIIIASHFIEHLSDQHFELLARYCKGIPFVYFDAPLKKENGNNWMGYGGSHKLTYGWDKVESIMKDSGYSVFRNLRPARLFKYDH